jgi:hypothetical protein
MRASLILVLLCSCSSESTSAPTPDSGSVDTGTVDPVMDTGAETGPKTSNELLLWTGNFGATRTTNLIFQNYAVDPGARCATKVDGPCVVVDCKGSDAAPPGVSAGTLTLTSNGTSLLTSSPKMDGSYPSSFKTGEQWDPGAALKISAEGADVPAFSVDFTAPSRPEITDPAVDSMPVLNRSADFVVKWKPTTGKVGVWVSQVPNTAELRTSTRFLCSFDAAAGTGTVPSSVVSTLQTTAALKTVGTNLNIGGVVEQSLKPGGYSIRAFAMIATYLDATVE